jgi:YidC/Oxa1 family membrane protein insertase
VNKNARIFLWLGLVLLLWLNFETWNRDYAPPPAPPAPVAGTPSSALSAAIPEASAPTTAAAPAAVAVPATPVADLGAATPALPAAAASTPAAAGVAAPAIVEAPTGVPGIVRVRTDVLDIDIYLAGGELSRADLLVYPLVKGQERPVRLLNRDGAGFYVMQSGLAGPAGAKRPTHLATFESGVRDVTMPEMLDELRVPLTWTDGAGVTVTKTYVFKRGSYRVDLQYKVDNRGVDAWPAASYVQLLRDDIPIERSMFDVESYAFKGPAFYDGNKYSKLKLDDEDSRNLSRDIQGGWIAGMQHHFTTAVVPQGDATYRYGLKVDGQQYLLSVAGPLREVAPGTEASFEETLFVGPKLQAQLKTTGPRLDLVADYGMLTLLADPLFWLLEKAHDLVGNWGWAIVLITALLKLVFYPLSEASGKSMAKMRVLAPRIKNLQDTYKDDREKLGKAMMELYQREKINPVAGCLPILVQMPVFFAFYWVLLESVEMRQAPFMGWIQDLSAKDPFFVLPIIMAGAMFIQYKLNPAPPDPIQAKVFMILPIVMSVTFAFFPAGLVLYWVTNTILSIAQQWNINRRIEAAAAAGKRV